MTTSQSWASILSGEPLPILPPVDDPELDKFFRDLLNYLRRLQSLSTTEHIFSEEDTRIDDLNGFIEQPENKSYTLVEYVEHKMQLKRITHIHDSEATCDLVVEVDRVALTGSGDVECTDDQGVFTFDANTVNVGSRIELTVSGRSSVPYGIDTRTKRTSIVTMNIPAFVPAPTVDGTIGASCRRLITHVYGGTMPAGVGRGVEDLAFTLKREWLTS